LFGEKTRAKGKEGKIIWGKIMKTAELRLEISQLNRGWSAQVLRGFALDVPRKRTNMCYVALYENLGIEKAE
jgi:hypothetical protein